jgi:hypothetical protein
MVFISALTTSKHNQYVFMLTTCIMLKWKHLKGIHKPGLMNLIWVLLLYGIVQVGHCIESPNYHDSLSCLSNHAVRRSNPQWNLFKRTTASYSSSALI